MPVIRALKRQEDQEFKVILVTTEILPGMHEKMSQPALLNPSPRKNLKLGLEAYACNPTV